MNYSVCPKCGHAPLPAEQSLPAACPACGIVLAKFGAVPARAPQADVEDAAPAGGFLARWLLHVPSEVSKANWYGRCALFVVVTLYTFKMFHDTHVEYGELGGHILWLLITPWHEAGHVIFRPFGQFMTILGGTICSIIFPIVLGIAVLVKGRNPFGAALCFWLLGYSVSYTGAYMHDAGDPQGMMLSGKAAPKRWSRLHQHFQRYGRMVAPARDHHRRRRRQDRSGNDVHGSRLGRLDAVAAKIQFKRVTVRRILCRQRIAASSGRNCERLVEGRSRCIAAIQVVASVFDDRG